VAKLSTSFGDVASAMLSQAGQNFSGQVYAIL